MSMLTTKLLRDLWAARGQVITIALVVASGIATFSASLSTYDSLKRMQVDYYERARFAHVFASARRAPDTVAPALREIAGVVDVQTTVSFEVMIDLPDVLEPLVGRMIALPEVGLPAINRLTLTAGRWIDRPGSNQVLVNDTFAERRGLVPGDTLTALLNGRLETLELVGTVLSPEYILPAAHGRGDDATFGLLWIGHERLAAAFDMEGAFNQVALRIGRGASERAVIAQLDRLLAPFGAIGAGARDEQPSHMALTQELAGLRVFGLVLPSVFLGVAVFMLNVVLARRIGTQRSQIAALKALGCEDWRIGVHYLQYVLVIVLLGVVAGVAAGAWLGHLLTAMYAGFFKFPVIEYALPAWVPLAGAAAALAAATAGALRAMLRVVRLAPAEAMRPASPPNFRATLLERAGLGRMLSPSLRMILREVERRPARTLATVLGVAGAVTILVAGIWWRDAVNHLLDVEFPMRERQDVSVMMVESAPSTLVHDLARLPGVLRAEPERLAPARLWHGHRSRRTTIAGIAPEATIRRPLDARLRELPLPAEGIALNETLAELLEVRLGDTVRVQMLQGERRQRELPVVALTGDLMGIPAFMDLATLNALAGEGDVVNSARLLVDGAARVEFLEQVKRTPRIGAAVELGPIVRTFRETTARHMLTFTTVLSVLAGTIAVGVVYNAARITLAERAWELASLRVLGMTRGEVSALLLGELALAVLVALPLGWLGGYALSAFQVALLEPETLRIPFVIQPSTYALASLVVLGAAAVSALIVRRQIDRLDLVGVLKTRD